MKKYKRLFIMVLLGLFSIGLMAAPMVLEYVIPVDDCELDLVLYGENFNVTVDWGDGNSENFTSPNGFKTHQYANAGTYIVQISGHLESFGNGGYHYQGDHFLTKIISFGDIGLIDLSGACANSSVTQVPTYLPSTVTNIHAMFYRCDVFNQNINSWDVSNVTNMDELFEWAPNFNQPLDSWDVSHVTTMRYMFADASAFNQDISSWDVSNVTQMQEMFENATSFDQNLGSWDVSNVWDFRWFLDGVTLSTPNYDALLIGWASEDLFQNRSFSGGNSNFSSGDAQAARQYIIEHFGWSITDGGEDQSHASITTQYATDETANSAIAHGKVTYLGTSDVTHHGFCWNTTGNPTTADDKIDIGSVSYLGTFSATLTLSPHTTYYLKTFITNSAGTNYGDEVKFRTHDIYSTIPAIPIEITGADGVSAQYHDLDSWDQMKAPGAVWDRNNFMDDPDNWYQTDPAEGSYWHNNPGGYGILVIDMHQVRTINQFSVFQMFFDGKTTGIQIYKNTEFLDSRQPLSFDPGWVAVTNIETVEQGTNNQTYISDPTIITPTACSTRYIMLHVYNDGSYGDNDFIELKGIKAFYFNGFTYSINYLRGGDLADPTVYTEDVTDITEQTAYFTGNVTDAGESSVTQYGACWNTSGDPDINDNKTEDFNNSFHSYLTNLSPSTTYFVRAYSTNAYGTSYGKTITFTTEAHTSTNGGTLFISEVCDNKPGEDEGTGFIELYNNTGSAVSLDGYSIMRGTNDGNGFVSDGYSYTIPNGYTIPNKGFFTIGNGATVGVFSDAWLKSFTSSNYDAGDSSLGITSGKAYALNDGSKAILDETPEVASNQRVHQTGDDNWTTETNSHGTPGEFGGDDALPVVLSSFTAIYANGISLLKWITMSESNNQGWNLYKSETNEISNAIKINPELIESTGNSTQQSSYTFRDNSELLTNKTYYYWLESIDYAGNTTLFDPISIVIEDNNQSPELPNETILQANYPNPFNPRTTINFSVKQGETAQLNIYNSKGQIVKTYPAFENGKHSIEWNGKDNLGKKVASGLYLYKLNSNSSSQIRKMILLK